MNVKLLAVKISKLLMQDGIAATARRATDFFRKSEKDPFDLINGVDTSRQKPLWALDISSPNLKHGIKYQAAGDWDLEAATKLIDQPLDRFTLIDLGAGKGKVLLLAAKLGFRKVIGVEFARELVEIAKRNLAIMEVPNSSVIFGDAAEFTFPDGDLVVFLYNPFDEQVLAQVLVHLGYAVAKNPEAAVYLIYVRPEFADVIDRAPFLRRVGVVAEHTGSIVWRALR